MRQAFLAVGLLLVAILIADGARAEVDWQAHEPATFERAADEEKLLLLDLVAVWCHWCHVMDETTYASPKVQAVLAEHFVAIKADHDARPDLAERYRDYGWPATIILTADGRELVKRAGYIDPQEMLVMLDQARDLETQGDPAPETGLPASSVFDLDQLPSLRRRLHARHVDSADPELGGLNLKQKFLDADTVEYDLTLAAAGDGEARRRARDYLDAAAKLVDPVFGGAYQYSTHGDWSHPHYEKIAATQAAYLRIYSRAAEFFDEPAYLRVADSVADYLNAFWRSPEGGFYNSQDADLVQGRKAHGYFAMDRDARLAKGIPRIDTNRYASSNGMLVEGLLALYQASRDEEHLKMAVDAFAWAIRERRQPQGGFAHGASDPDARYLADSLYMGRAMLAIYRATGQTQWLELARETAAYLRVFMHELGGLSAAIDDGTPIEPQPQIDQNIHAARFLIALSLEGDPHARDLAKHVMRYLTRDDIALSRLTDAGIILATDELLRIDLSSIQAESRKGEGNARS